MQVTVQYHFFTMTLITPSPSPIASSIGMASSIADVFRFCRSGPTVVMLVDMACTVT